MNRDQLTPECVLHWPLLWLASFIAEEKWIVPYLSEVGQLPEGIDPSLTLTVCLQGVKPQLS